jgi:hypothetical protein
VSGVCIMGYSSVLFIRYFTLYFVDMLVFSFCTVCSSLCFYIGCTACVLLTGVHFLQCSEYLVMCVNVCVIHLQVIFVDLIYLVLFQCV